MTAPIKRKSQGSWNPALGGREGALKLVADLGSDRAINRRVRAVRLAGHHRITRIRGGANRHMQRDFAQKRYAQPLGLVSRTAMAENVRSRAAMRTLEIAHI